MLVVPMRYDEVVGVITLSKLGLGGFDADDLRLLTILADQAATALETARLLARSQALAGELRRLLDMSGELSESLDPRQVANLMAGHLAPRWASTSARSATGTGRAAASKSLGYHPASTRGLEPYFDVAGYPETRPRARARRRPSSSTPTTRPPTPPRSGCCAATATGCW